MNVPYYYNAPPVVQNIIDSTGKTHQIISADIMRDLQIKVEGQLSTLTIEMQRMQDHANWIEPRLHEFIRFNIWMEQAHPDIIDAFKKSTAVVKVLDKANSEEMIYPQAEASA